MAKDVRRAAKPKRHWSHSAEATRSALLRELALAAPYQRKAVLRRLEAVGRSKPERAAAEA